MITYSLFISVSTPFNTLYVFLIISLKPHPFDLTPPPTLISLHSFQHGVLKKDKRHLF